MRKLSLPAGRPARVVRLWVEAAGRPHPAKRRDGSPKRGLLPRDRADPAMLPNPLGLQVGPPPDAANAHARSEVPAYLKIFWRSILRRLFSICSSGAFMLLLSPPLAYWAKVWNGRAPGEAGSWAM